MITTEDAAAYLAELGLSVPAAVLACIVEKANSAEACMIGAGYDACDITLSLLYLTGMLAISAGGRRIKSQGAPSGASRSFEYGTITEQMRQLRASLQVLDASGCTTALQPAEPGPRAGLWIGKGGCLS